MSARILVYTGKGGVGKTSVAAATALACADRGYRTIIISTDIAHSLGDAFARELGPEPLEISPNLWAQESDVFFNVKRYWGRIQEYAASVLRWRGLDDVMAEEMTVLPGMDEVGSLLWIADHHDSGRYDVVVVDAAPTGETLRLLSLPEARRWWMQKVEPLGRRITKLTGPIVKRVVGVPIPGDDVFDAGEALFARLEDLHRLLDRSGHDLDPRRPHPRAGRDRRGAALVHLLPPVRLPDRPRDREPRPARRGRRVLPRLVRGAAALRAAGRQHLPSDPGPQGAVLRPRDGRHRPAASSWRSPCTATTIRSSSSTAAARTRSHATTGPSCCRSTSRSPRSARSTSRAMPTS